MEMSSKILNALNALKDEKYQKFSLKINPGARIIGVRIPLLRKLCREFLKKEDPKKLLGITVSKDSYLEEKMCKGIFIAENKTLTLKKRLPYIKEYLSCMTGWAECDMFCSELKECKYNQEEYLSFIDSVFEPTDAGRIRFACVMLLLYYNEEKYFNHIFSTIRKIKSDDYYVQMGVAWLLSALIIRHGVLAVQKTLKLKLDRKVLAMTIQKVKDSYRLDKDEKQELVMRLKFSE